MNQKLPFPAVSASVSCMDLGNMQRHIEAVEASEVSFFHYDVVDGKFNQCYILGDTLCRYIKAHSRLPIEVHLAVMEVEPYITIFAKMGADYLAVHYESLKNPKEVFKRIKALGAQPVLAYRAETAPGDDFIDLAGNVAWILKLTVHPGFSGQKMQVNAIEHIRLMQAMGKAAGMNLRIQADGNVNRETVPILRQAGANIFTGGTSGLFLKGRTIQENIDQMLLKK